MADNPSDASSENGDRSELARRIKSRLCIHNVTMEMEGSGQSAGLPRPKLRTPLGHRVSLVELLNLEGR